MHMNKMVAISDHFESMLFGFACFFRISYYFIVLYAQDFLSINFSKYYFNKV